MLKPYDVVIDGNRTTLLLSDADAKARGLSKPNPVQKTRVPAKPRGAANKAATPANK